MSSNRHLSDTYRLRTFAKTGFIVLLAIGTFAVLGGFAVMAFSINLAVSYIITGVLCILGAFGVLYILNVLAGIADYVKAQYAQVEHIRRAAESIAGRHVHNGD